MKKPTLKDWAEQVAVLVFVKVARLLPPRAVPKMAAMLGVLLFDVVRYRRQVALSNLDWHLGRGARDPDVSNTSKERRYHERIGRECLTGFVMGLAEFARLPLIDKKYMDENIEVSGLEHLDEALKRGKGGILVTGHFGSWELMGWVVARLGYPLKFVVGVQRNPLVQVLMNDIRRSCGIQVIEPDSLLGVARSLKSNQFVAMLSDQDVGRRGVKGVFVDFMGESASTPRGAAQFSLIAGSPIIPGFIVRTGGTKHRIVIERPILPPDRRDETSVRELTQAYTKVIETYVRSYPGHWLWTHRRWKTRPA